MGHEARIWASRLGFRPQGCDMSFEGGGRTEEEEEEKFVLCESIGHRPLRGRCPKTKIKKPKQEKKLVIPDQNRPYHVMATVGLSLCLSVGL